VRPDCSSRPGTVSKL